MIRTILRLPLKPGCGPNLVESFVRLGIFDESMANPGCRSVEMALAVDGSEAIVTAIWEGADAYSAWTRRESSGIHREVFNQFLADPIIETTARGIYEIAHSRAVHPSGEACEGLLPPRGLVVLRTAASGAARR